METMKLKRFSFMHPYVLFAYYIFLFAVTFTSSHSNLVFVLCNNILLVVMCGCIKEFISTLKFFLAFSLFILLTNYNIHEQFIYMTQFSSASVLFLSFNKLIDSSKFLFVFAKFLPNTALVINISLRYSGLLLRRLKEIRDVANVNSKTHVNKFKATANVLTVLLRWIIIESCDLKLSFSSKKYLQRKTLSYNLSHIDIVFLFSILIFGLAFHFFNCYLIFSVPFAYDIMLFIKSNMRRKSKCSE